MPEPPRVVTVTVQDCRDAIAKALGWLETLGVSEEEARSRWCRHERPALDELDKWRYLLTGSTRGEEES